MLEPQSELSIKLRDALRLISWSAFSREKGLDRAYTIFNTLFFQHPIHQMSEAELIQYVEELGWGVEQLLLIRETEYGFNVGQPIIFTDVID